MALNNIQERVERSIYEVIRKVLVDEGYLPDITLPQYNNTVGGETQWETDIKTIETAKGFATEVFGHSSSLSKGNQRIPRIVIIPRRIMPGEVGPPLFGEFQPDPSNPDQLRKLKPAVQSANLHLDINVVSGQSNQDRLLHAVLAKALSTWSYVPMYDSPDELFFVRQFNFYDLPDDRNGIEEKVYSYEIPDLYLYEGEYSNVAAMNEIKVYMWTSNEKNFPSRPITIPSPGNGLEGIIVDLSGIHYNLQ